MAILAMTALLAALPTGRARADAVALVLDASGDVPQALAPFTEVEPGGEHALGDNTSLLFLHYGKCEEVLVRGGTLSFSAQNYNLRGGEVLETKVVKCPETFAATGNANSGGIVLRSGNRAGLRLSREPGLLLAGRSASRVASLRFRCNNGMFALAVGVSKPRFSWPSGGKALPEGPCTLELLAADGTALGEVDVTIADRGSRRQTLIRID